MRYLRYLCLGLLVLLTVIGVSLFFHKGTPLFLKNSTFIEGMGLESLGKHFLLRHKADRALFLCGKHRVRVARQKWRSASHPAIPRLIHFIWLSRGALSEDLLQAQALVQETQPDCRLMVWDRKAILKLMTPKQESLFMTLPPCIQRELARALVLHHSGGVVLDCELQVLSSFNDIFSSGNWIVTFEPPLEKAFHGRHLWLSTVFMAATPKNPSVASWLHTMFAYFQTHEVFHDNNAEMMVEGVLLPLIQQFSKEQQGIVYALPATCCIPIAPRFIDGYLQKLAGETVKNKGTSACMGLVRAPFSKIVRESFALQRRGGRMSEIIHKKK